MRHPVLLQNKRRRSSPGVRKIIRRQGNLWINNELQAAQTTHPVLLQNKRRRSSPEVWKPNRRQIGGQLNLQLKNRFGRILKTARETLINPLRSGILMKVLDAGGDDLSRVESPSASNA